MNDAAHTPPAADMEKVGFRDIYRAVGESESRIKEHISLVLLPITTAVADHETRIRDIEERGSTLARETFLKSEAIRVGFEALESRVDKLDDRFLAVDAAVGERRRIAGMTNKTLALIVLVGQFTLAFIIFIANLMTAHPSA